MENLSTSNQELFDEIVERALAEGVQNEIAFGEFVEFVIDEKLGVGELHDDNDRESMSEVLKARFSEYEKKLMERAV